MAISVHDLCKERGISLLELAEQTGLDLKRVQAIYWGRWTPSPQEREVIDFVNTVREEDIPICESVQRGLHSQGYSRGKFIADPERSYISEHAVHDFQTKVAAALEID